MPLGDPNFLNARGWECPRCGSVLAPFIGECSCTRHLPWQRAEPCAFDGLKPGVYGLVCYCPKCMPRFL